PVNTFANGDIVFISGKYIIEGSEPHFAIAYASIVDNKNSNREFDATDLPECISHCVYSVTINREPKKIEEFIHFGAEAVEYNSVTTKPNIKIDMTIVYPLQSPKFKYLGYLGSNIKLRTNYFVSGLIRFSKSGKMIIEATDIDYLKTSAINLTESTSLVTPNTPSIIDLIDDDLNPANSQTFEEPAKLFKTPDVNIEDGTSYAPENNNPPDSVSSDGQDHENQFDDDNSKIMESCDNEDLHELQPKKRKKNTTRIQKEK
ncbi:14248_t:CDS:1, partial [Racocetra persica]